MNPIILQTLIGVVTFIISGFVSASVSMFIAGMRWGTVQKEVQFIKDRLIKIEGMFEMKLKEN